MSEVANDKVATRSLNIALHAMSGASHWVDEGVCSIDGAMYSQQAVFSGRGSTALGNHSLASCKRGRPLYKQSIVCEMAVHCAMSAREEQHLHRARLCFISARLHLQHARLGVPCEKLRLLLRVSSRATRSCDGNVGR